jgi:hypothetical protein
LAVERATRPCGHFGRVRRSQTLGPLFYRAKAVLQAFGIVWRLTGDESVRWRTYFNK